MTTFEGRVTAGADDGYVNSSTTGFDNSSALQFTGPTVGRYLWPFVRRAVVDVPAGAAVSASYLRFRADGDGGPGLTYTIFAADEDDAAAPATAADYKGRTLTTASVSWVLGAWTGGADYDTPDLTAIVQEIINRPGWVSGNAILFLIRDGNAAATTTNLAVSFDSTPAVAPLLHIEYTAPDPINEIEPLRFYLLPQPSTTVFTGRVTSAPADPYINIAYNTGVTGSFGEPLPGQTVWFGSTSGGQERGVRRLRSWSGAGTLKIDESDDTGPQIQAGDYITIKWDFRLWPKYPRFIQAGENVTIYEDYDIAYDDQTLDWYPTAVCPPPGVAEIEAGIASLQFVEGSFANAPGATITAWLWKAWDSVEGTSNSQGTEASPVVFTWAAAGWHLVSLTVTDSNGNSHTAYTWAIIIDPASPDDVAFLDFDAINDNHDFDQNGGSCSFVVRGSSATVATFPAESLLVHACFGNQTTPTASWPYRTNVLFAGYILSDTAQQSPETGEVSFRAGTIDSIMGNLSSFSASLTSKAAPADWTEVASLTVDRCISYMAKWRSTLDSIAPIVPCGYAGLIHRQVFGKGDLLGQIQNELMKDVWGKVVVSPQGVVHFVIDYNLQTAAERAAVTVGKTLHKGIWINDVYIEQRGDYQWPTNQVKMSGIAYFGGDIEDICPLFSEAPGDAMKSYGREAAHDGFILISQDELNERCGYALAKANANPVTFRMQFLNDGSFSPSPQEVYPAIIEARDNNRGLAYSGNLIPRRLSRQYDHRNGYYIVSVDFEPETTGPAGVTVDVPCGPPEQKLVGTPPPPLATNGPVALVAGTTGTSAYYAPGAGQSWQRRVSGLADPSQIAFLDLIPDPWSTFKQGYSPDKVILWGCGRGFLVRSLNSGQTWKDRTSYLDAPAWPGETGTALTAVDLIGLQADIFSEDRLYVLARWQYTGAYHGAIARSDDGFVFEWHNLTGSAQVRPLGFAVNQGNGTSIWATAWESDPTGTIFIRRYGVADFAQAGYTSLGFASAAEVDAREYYASPLSRRGQAGEVYAFGRMLEPAGLTGTSHILKNTTGGTGTWSVVEDGWASNTCGALVVDEAGNLYAVRNG